MKAFLPGPSLAPAASPSAARAPGGPQAARDGIGQSQMRRGQDPTCGRVGFACSPTASFLSKVHGQGGCSSCQRAL